MKLSETKQRAPQHLSVSGDPKSGKSTIVSQLAEHGFKLIWVSLDNGHGVLYKLSSKAQENIELIVLPDTAEFPIAEETCRKIIKGDRVLICHMHGQVNCSHCNKNQLPFTEVCMNEEPLTSILVIDNGSQLAISVMNKITKGKADDFKFGYDEYRTQGTIMDKFLTNVQQARFNVIVITHLVETEMEDGKKKLVPQVGTTSFSRNVGKYFDHMVHCDVRNMGHKFGSSTTYSAMVTTGSRSDVAIEKEKVPSLVPFFTIAAEAKAEAQAEEKVTVVAQLQKAADSLPEKGVDPAVVAAATQVAEDLAKAGDVLQKGLDSPPATTMAGLNVATPSAAVPAETSAEEKARKTKELLEKLKHGKK